MRNTQELVQAGAIMICTVQVKKKNLIVALDSCSNISFIKVSTATIIEAKTISNDNFLSVESLQSVDSATWPVFQFQLPNQKNTLTFRAVGTDKIARTQIPDYNFKKRFKTMNLNPIPSGQVVDIDILLGAGQMWRVIKTEKVVRVHSDAVLFNTLWGWIPCGRVGTAAPTTTTTLLNSSEKLSLLLERLLDLDKLTTESQGSDMTMDEQKALDLLSATLS
ncbi:Hypothetical predicted protein, partial [Paramuricea clavata]